MKIRLLYPMVIIAILIAVACTPKATPPPVDVIGTMAVQMASVMLTQTVAAYSPTSPATETPLPVTATLVPTKGTNGNIIIVVTFTGCYRGPGTNYPLQSYINVPKKVELLGIGSVPGWYIIKGPYFYTACWVAAADVQIPTTVDLTKFPVMTPTH